MPDINDPKRSNAPTLRAENLIQSAETEIRNKWTGRSWTDVISSVYANARGWAMSMDGLKIAINFTTGGLVDRVASLTGLDKLGEHWSNTVLQQVWALMEDDLKGAAQKGAEDYGVNSARSMIASLWHRVRGTAPPRDCDEIMEKSEQIKMRFAEMYLRIATLKKVMDNGTFRFCDDVHYAMRELAHAELCRAEVIQNCNETIALMEEIRRNAVNAMPNVAADKDSLKRIAERVVADTSTIQHKMHQNYGVVGAVWNARDAYNTIQNSCSKEKCFGPKPAP